MGLGATTSASGRAVKHHVGRCREGDPLATEDTEYLAVTDLSTNQTQVLANYKVSGEFLGDPPTFTTTRTNNYFTSPPIRPSLTDTVLNNVGDLFDEPAFVAVPLAGAGSGLGTGGSGLGAREWARGPGDRPLHPAHPPLRPPSPIPRTRQPP